MITGGAHAREWAPPDALFNFMRKLLIARNNNLDITFSSGGVTYSDPAYVIKKAAVAEIFNRFNLLIFPLVNPDGRHFSMTGISGTPTAKEQMWRKNRRPFSGSCFGVDINRNFGIAWNHHKYYRPDAANNADVQETPCNNSTTDPVNEVYKGDNPFSEPETTAVGDLVLQNMPEVFIDVHLFGREIQYPWGMDRNQVVFPNQNFLNPDHDHKPTPANSGRDGLLGNNYGEFVPTDTFGRVKQLANVMRDEILISAGLNPIAKQRSTYRVGQTVDFGPPPRTFVGGADDWAFSRQFSPTSFGEVFAFTLEAGKGQSQTNPSDEHDGGFFPNDQQYLKVEQEIHAGLFGLLTKGGL